MNNIREAIPNKWPEKVRELRELGAASGAPSLATYLNEVGLELDDVYANHKSWSDLCSDAGLAVAEPGPQEVAMRRGCGRMLHVDDTERIHAFRQLIQRSAAPDLNRLSERERRYLRMLVGSLVTRHMVSRTASLAEGCELLFAHPQVRSELLEVLDVLEGQIPHVQSPLQSMPDVPLQVHARYSRVEILAGFGIGKGARVAPWQTGVYFAKQVPVDLMAFTLDKTSGHFSSHHSLSRLRDQSGPDSLGESVRNQGREQDGRSLSCHQQLGSHVMLFARLRKDDRAFFFLGPASYVSHGSDQPMAITWRLEHPLPGDVFTSFAAAVA